MPKGKQNYQNGVMNVVSRRDSGDRGIHYFGIHLLKTVDPASFASIII